MIDPNYWRDKWKDERIHSKALEGEVCRAKEDNDRLRSLIAELVEALQGVVKVADRDTTEFAKARAILAKAKAEEK